MKFRITTGMKYEISLTRSAPESFIAAVALSEADMAFKWDEDAPTIGSEDRPVRICATAASESPSGEHRLDCQSLLQFIETLEGGQVAEASALLRAVERTQVHSAVRLMRTLAAHSIGDPVVPITLEVRRTFAELEALIAGPVFIPEQFTYVSARYFRGEEFSIVDAAIAGVFRAAAMLGDQFLHSVVFDLPKICALNQALASRSSVAQTARDVM